MQKPFSLLIILLFSLNTYSQDTDYIKLIQNDFITLNKHSKKIVQSNDTGFLFIYYNNKTFDVLNVYINRWKTQKQQVSYLFGSNGKLWIRVNEILPTTKRKNQRGKGDYYFINGKLVAKEANQYLKYDYSHLVNEAEFYRNIGILAVNAKR